jgi:DNA-binding NarL/FixJ family response regulator
MTIYVLESHPLMAQAIAFLIRRIDATKRVIEVHNFSKLQEAMLINGQPEAFLLDPLMIGLSGTIGIKQIKHNYPTTPLILFSSIPRDEAERNCKEAGADLYIEKTSPPKVLAELIQKQLGWTQKFKVIATQGIMDDGLIKLSKRQKQLLVLVDAGLCNDDIAKKLDISAHTVKVHLWRFYKKLGISSRTQLSKFARDNGYM